MDDKTIINTEPRGSNETQHNITNIVDPSAEKEKLHKGFPHLLKGSFLLEKYEVVGTFADLSSKNVSLYKCENRGNVYIAKIYHWKESISFDMINRIMGLRSPYIAEVVAIGEYEGYPCEIIRYYSGVDLHEKRLTLNQMVQIIYQLNEGLRTLHSNNIIHGDIKPGNIVISGFDNSDSELIEAKIIDFGICQFVPNAQTKLYALGHTPGYDAPELHNDYAFAADYYSLGVSILSFMIGGNPFEEMKHAERVTLLKELFSRYQLAPEFKELLDGLIANNPRDRWTYNKIASWCGNNGIIKISELASKRDEKFRYGYKGTNRQFALENMPVVDPECLHYSLFCVVENLLTRGEPTPLSMFLKNLFNKEIINDGDIDYIFSYEIAIIYFLKSGILKLAEKVWNVDLIIAESVRKSQQELFQIAFNDIWLFMKNLLTLLGIHIEKPRVNFHSKKATATIATVSEKETYFIPESAMLIRPLNEVTNQQYRIATAPPIIYNTLRPDPDDCIREALEFFLIELFGYDHFNSGQLDIVKAALARQDVIGILPTGSGKSLCYQLSGLLQPCISFIVAPLISLIQDQKFNLDSFSIVRTAAIASHNTSEANKAFLDDFGDGRYQFVWISPERFMIKSFRAKLNKIAKRNYYGYAVIDEAHCISEWGHDFRISYLTLANTIRNYCPGAKLIGLTATASENVLTDICAELNLSLDSVRAGSEMDRPELHYHFIRCENNDERRQRLLMELSSLNERYERNLHENIFETTGEDTIAGIIFANTKGNYRQQNGCDDINAFLRRNGYAHGRTFFAPREGEKDNRAEIQKAFLNNEFPFIIATKAFGMGVNKKNIRYTIHFGLPWSIESFYQEAGRAGRDKEKDNHSDNYILYIPERDESAEKMISVLENPNSHIENIMSEQLTGDLNSIVWLWLQNNRPVDQQLKTIMEIYHFLLSGKTRFSLRDFHYSQFECDSALHKLMLVGYIIDWTYDYGTNTYDVTSTNEWTRYVAERKIKEYLSKFKAVNTFEKSELYHEYLNSDSGALLSKLMRALLIWIDENIIYSRRMAIVNMYRFCERNPSEEEIRQYINSFFRLSTTDNARINSILSVSTDIEAWLSIFYNYETNEERTYSQKKLRSQDEIVALSALIDRYRESYRGNIGLEVINYLAKQFDGERYLDYRGELSRIFEMDPTYFNEHNQNLLISYSLPILQTAPEGAKDFFAKEAMNILPNRLMEIHRMLKDNETMLIIAELALTRLTKSIRPK